MTAGIITVNNFVYKFSLSCFERDTVAFFLYFFQFSWWMEKFSELVWYNFVDCINFVNAYENVDCSYRYHFLCPRQFVDWSRPLSLAICCPAAQMFTAIIHRWQHALLFALIPSSSPATRRRRWTHSRTAKERVGKQPAGGATPGFVDRPRLIAQRVIDRIHTCRGESW